MRAPLNSGAYQAKSIIANNQAAINLYAEENPKNTDAPVTYTHYLTPGLTLLATPTSAASARCTYRATNGKLYYVVGNTVYYVDSSWTLHNLGTIGTSTGICYMADNGIQILLVDGTSSGYTIALSSGVMTVISDVAFYGGTRVDYLSTFFLLNKPGTLEFYTNIPTDTTAQGIPVFSDVSNPGGIFGLKLAYADFISTLIVMHNEVWLLGTSYGTEIWYNAGASPFPFAKIPNVFIEHGCVANASIAKQDLNIYWLSRDLQGGGIVLRGNSYSATRISTHAIEQAISTYSTISDAVGFTYQQEGHVFYVLNFPSADATWVFDETTGLWHQRAWIDNNGALHKWRGIIGAHAYDKIVVGDWENGNLYAVDPNNFTDNGQPITRIRTWPHSLNELNRVAYSAFVADMQVGMDDGSVDGTDSTNPPVVYLSWSDDRGQTFNNGIEQSMGAIGQYLTFMQWQRLGISRDRVWKLLWSTPALTALNGAYVDFEKSET